MKVRFCGALGCGKMVSVAPASFAGGCHRDGVPIVCCPASGGCLAQDVIFQEVQVHAGGWLAGLWVQMVTGNFLDLQSWAFIEGTLGLASIVQEVITVKLLGSMQEVMEGLGVTNRVQ